MVNKMKLEIDPVGQYYSSIANEKQPGIFSITARLKETVRPDILQLAVNDVIRRLPFISGRLKGGFFCYYYEIIKEPPQILPASEPYTFSYYYKNGSHVLRVLYGERHFAVETTHSVCDGRGLEKVTSALLVRYFELLGLTTGKDGIIDCTADVQEEEAENAYARYANTQKTKLSFEKMTPSVKAYHSKCSQISETGIITQKFDAGKMKAAAKAFGATISEFILAHIFTVIAEERKARGCTKPITASVPIDCRSFFPSKTLRSFVSSATIVMPESAKDFSEMIRQTHSQFTRIDKDYVLSDICEVHKLYNSMYYLPRILKKLGIKMIEYSEAASQTTGFSNLGLVKLPKEIEEHIDILEFAIGLAQDTPYFFSCITFGNVLALTATVTPEGAAIAEKVNKTLEKSLEK